MRGTETKILDQGSSHCNWKLNPPPRKLKNKKKSPSRQHHFLWEDVYSDLLSVLFSVCCFHFCGLRACLGNMSSSLFPFLRPNHPHFILPPCFPNSAQLKTRLGGSHPKRIKKSYCKETAFRTGRSGEGAIFQFIRSTSPEKYVPLLSALYSLLPFGNNIYLLAIFLWRLLPLLGFK